MGTLLSLMWLIAGLPWTAWLLGIASTGIGLAIVVTFYLRHSRSSKAGKS